MRRFLSILLVLGMLLSVPVCGVTAAAADASPAGSYRLTAVVGGEGSELEIISTVLDLGVNYYLFLREDGTGSMRFMEAELPLTWDEDTLSILPFGKNPRSLTLPLSCADGSLSIRTRAYSMEFRALTEDEQRQYDLNGAGSLAGMAAVLAMRLIGSMDGELADNLFLALALGAMGDDPDPIPEGEPSEGVVTGEADGLEFAVLGADRVHDAAAGDVMVFWFDMTNTTDELRAAWELDTDAAQDGAELEPVYELEDVPELFNVNLQIIPGRTLRCAAAFRYDPDGGTVGLRIRPYRGEGEVLFYADPKAPSGAPEAVGFESALTIPEAWKDLPEETENVRFESAELIRDEENGDLLRCCIRSQLVSEDGFSAHYCTLFQDGVELIRVWDNDEADPGGDVQLIFHSCRPRTDSPVYALVFEEGPEGDVPVALKVVEIG